MEFSGYDALQARTFAERWLPAWSDGLIARNLVYFDRAELLRAIAEVRAQRRL
jgi:hypothetical protein